MKGTRVQQINNIVITQGKRHDYYAWAPDNQTLLFSSLDLNQVKEYCNRNKSFVSKKQVQKMHYYDIHVSYDEDEGYSVFVAVPFSYNEKQAIITYARNRHLFTSDGDYEDIDYIEEITLNDYREAVGQTKEVRERKIKQAYSREKMHYYDIHVSYDEDEGYSVFVAVPYKPNEIAKIKGYAKTKKLFESEGDYEDIDYINEISEKDYKDATGDKIGTLTHTESHRNENANKVYYYEICVNYGDEEGYSVCIDAPYMPNEHKAIKQYALKRKAFFTDQDYNNVEYIKEISKEQYLTARKINRQ